MGSLDAAAQDRVKWKQFVGGLCSTLKDKGKEADQRTPGEEESSKR